MAGAVRRRFLNLAADVRTLDIERAEPFRAQRLANETQTRGSEGLMLRCRDLVELFADYLEGELDSATARTVEAHLAGCRDCTAFINTYRGAIGMLRELRESQLPAELRERLLRFCRGQNPS